MKKILSKYVISSTLIIMLVVILLMNFIGLGGYPFIIIFISFSAGLCILFLNPSFKNSDKEERKNYFEGFIICSVILIGFGLTHQYELVTDFGNPYWSPDGKQIAFIMERRLTKYHPGLFAEVPSNKWDKYYLCIMDNNGTNYKIIKETNNQVGEPRQYLEYYNVIWPSTQTIIYNQLMQDNFHSSKFQGKSYKIHPDGSGLEKLWQWDENSEYRNVRWLTQAEDYIVLEKYDDKGQRFAIYNTKKKKIKKEILFPGQLYGSYKNNTIAITTEYNITILDLDTLKIQSFDWKEKETEAKLLSGYDLGAISPDRSMRADTGSLGSNDSTIFIYKDNKKSAPMTFSIYNKRSYLFNIFLK